MATNMQTKAVNPIVKLSPMRKEFRNTAKLITNAGIRNATQIFACLFVFAWTSTTYLPQAVIYYQFQIAFFPLLPETTNGYFPLVLIPNGLLDGSLPFFIMYQVFTVIKDSRMCPLGYFVCFYSNLGIKSQLFSRIKSRYPHRHRTRLVLSTMLYSISKDMSKTERVMIALQDQTSK